MDYFEVTALLLSAGDYNFGSECLFKKNNNLFCGQQYQSNDEVLSQQEL